MRSLTHFLGGLGGGLVRLLACTILMAFAAALAAAEALFPQPLHLTRRIEDPVSKTTTTVHEYCAGNQVVSIAGDRISIADHGRQELTEIDRAAGTYSVTSFADLAAAEAAVRSPSRRARTAVGQAAAPRWKVSHENEAEAVTFDASTGGPSKMTVRVDRATRLSKAAFEVLIGAAFPHQRSDVHDALFTVAANRGGDRKVAVNSLSPETLYALPVDQTLSFDVAGDHLTVRSTILDVRADLVPPGTLTIPPGSKLVESHAVRLAREFRDADQLPATPSH